MVEVDSRATIDSDFSHSQPLDPQPVPTQIPSVNHSWAIANKPFGVIYAGPPGGFALLGLGYYGPPVPTPFGDLYMQGPIISVGIVGLPNPDGIHVQTLFMPSGVPSGVAFNLQAMTLSLAGEFTLTTPSPLVVSYELGQTP